MRRLSNLTLLFLFLVTLQTTASATAAKHGDGNSDRFVSPHFSGPGVCAPCHNGLYDLEGEDVSIERDWSQSLMSFSFIDPLWIAKVESEVLRNPDLQELIEKKCATCHAPMAVTEAAFSGDPVRVLGAGSFNDPDNPYYLLAHGGVGCTLCHQIEDSPELGTDAGNSGNYSIGDYVDPYQRPSYGQHRTPFATSMLNSARFSAIYSPHIHDSAFCATCHDLKTPYVDSEGNVVDDLFPEQMPYREWLESDYSRQGHQTTCQNCHAPQSETAAPMARGPVWLAAVDNFSRHTYYTENTLMLRILDLYAEELGVSKDLSVAIAAGKNYLSEAGDIDILASGFEEDGRLSVTLQVTNLTGHKLPTSIPIRRVFIHFQVFDETGQLVFESGRPLPDGRIKGVDADAVDGALKYENHHRVISAEDEVMVYEGIMGDTDGQVTYTLLRAAQFLKDNRIPPAGFDKHSVAEDILPAGGCMTDEDFNSGSDRVTYLVEGLATGNYRIEATLYDQTLSYRFISDLFSQEDAPLVDRFERMYDSVKKECEEIAHATRLVSR